MVPKISLHFDSLLDSLAFPVDISTGPVNCALGVLLVTTRPDRKLHSGGCLGELPLVGSGVPGLGFLPRSANLIIYKPLNLFWSPPDLVRVPFGIRVLDG